jgi:DNA-binding transcriptional ArsR family regulator
MPEKNTLPLISWDFGTAYDFFASLRVLHEPAKFDLRASWAAGVRSRLSQADRETIERSMDVIHFPAGWIHSLPAPKDAASALRILADLPPAERLPALGLMNEFHPVLVAMLRAIAAKGSWDESDREQLRSLQPSKLQLKPKSFSRFLDTWAHPAEFGEAYLQALRSYQAAFFSEEEGHIQGVLKESLSRAQRLSESYTPVELIEDLSEGVRVEYVRDLEQILLVPSYWISPLIVIERLDPTCILMLFGARPKELSLVPGEAIPDTMLRAMKALADPTRMKILRYLGQQPYTPAQLARLLRLRAPTMTHHLNTLRLAGLVHLTLAGEGEKMYQARPEAVDGAFKTLKEFLNSDSDHQARNT